MKLSRFLWLEIGKPYPKRGQPNLGVLRCYQHHQNRSVRQNNRADSPIALCVDPSERRIWLSSVWLSEKDKKVHKNTPNAKKTQYSSKSAKNRGFSPDEKAFAAYQQRYPRYCLHEDLKASPTIERLFTWFYKPFSPIIADSPKAREGKPEWRTENSYPMAKRTAEALFHDPAVQIGFRPDETTGFAGFDIDSGSSLHPSGEQGTALIQRLLEVAEEHGLVAFKKLQSSHSGGIHLVSVFDKPLRSIEVAALLRSIALKAGFKLKDGELEAFPNTKTYVNSPNPEDWSIFRGLRCPGQAGSGWQLLDEDFVPVGDRLETLVSQLEWVEAKNDSADIWRNAQIAYEELRVIRRLRNSVSRAAFISDLHTEMDIGFTANGQTNALLKLAGTLGRVEHGLRGEALTRFISDTVQGLPGYKEYCRHQHEIDRRAREWARSVENFYWHVSDPDKVRHGSYAQMWKRATKSPIDAERPTCDQYHFDRANDASRRLESVLKALSDAGEVFTSETSLFAAVCAKGRELFGKALSKRTWQKLKAKFTAIVVTLINKVSAIVEPECPEAVTEVIEPAADSEVAENHTQKTPEPQVNCARTQPPGNFVKPARVKTPEPQVNCARTQPRLYMKVFEYLSKSQALVFWERLRDAGVVCSYQGLPFSGLLSEPPPESERLIFSQHSRIETIKPLTKISFLDEIHTSHFGQAYSELLTYVKPAVSDWSEGIAVPLKAIAIPIDKHFLSLELRRAAVLTDKFSLSRFVADLCERMCFFSDRSFVAQGDDSPLMMPPDVDLLI